MLPELKLPATDLEAVGDRIQALLDAIAAAGTADDPRAVIKSVAWPHTISNLLRTSVEEMLKLDADQRAQVAAAFRHDRAFPSAHDDSTFAFAYPELDATTADAARALLKPMYRRFVDRTALEAAWRVANPQLGFCPYCFMSSLTLPIDGRTFLHADHVLPQDLYPHLSAHPENLVIVCTDCNTFKSNADPLADQGVVLTLPQTYLPYRRWALPELKLDFSLTEPDAPPLRMRGTRAGADDRLSTLNRILEVEHRWNGVLDIRHAIIMDLLVDEHGADLDPEAIRATLLDYAAQADRAARRAPIEMIDRDWARWLAGDGLDTTMTELRRRVAPPVARADRSRPNSGPV